ncbi:MAG: hypothetical protein NT159_03670 [Proteobacteria bacterium]|nr:hypothetical protein [Pseudomonadota bacterium]
MTNNTCIKTLIRFVIVWASLLAASAEAAGPYDGIWTISYLGTPVRYYSVHENDGMMIMLQLPTTGSWEAFYGTRNGNAVIATTLASGVNLNASVTFTSTTTLTIKINSCVAVLAGWHCSFSAGNTLQGIKIF